MHASLTLDADADLGRERLCRYGLRPPFSLSRFRVLRDGRISQRVKKSSRRVSRCRIMTPVECIARLCALVPLPRYPLTRFHEQRGGPVAHPRFIARKRADRPREERRRVSGRVGRGRLEDRAAVRENIRSAPG